jgi:hypothetical protein
VTATPSTCEAGVLTVHAARHDLAVAARQRGGEFVARALDTEDEVRGLHVMW